MNKERFLETIVKHKMNITGLSGLIRSIEFRDPADGNRHFTLTTWPYHLCISGDMGTYTFKHYNVDDMFKLFRSKELGINEGYWSEKLASNSLFRGFQFFDFKSFKESVTEVFNEYCTENPDFYEDEKSEAWENIEDTVLCHEDSEELSYNAIWYYSDIDELFTDFWDNYGGSFKEYGGNYIWCLFAIVWGIQQFDASEKS